MISSPRFVLPAVLAAILALLLAGCAAVETVFVDPTPTPILTDPGPDECFRAVKIVVWGDLNGNGLFDEDEPPIEGALLRVIPQGDPQAEAENFSTSGEGRAFFPTREIDDCDHTDHAVLFLRQVAGYEFPAEPVVNLDDYRPNEDEVGFGLTPLE